MKDVLGGLGLASDIDNLSEYSSTECDLDPNNSLQTSTECDSEPNNSLQTIEQKGDDDSNYRGVMELSRIVDALFDLAPALGERIDQILEREKIWEMDLPATVITVASKFPQAPDRFVSEVARGILKNRSRLHKKLTGAVWGEPVVADPGLRRPNAPTLFSEAPLRGSFGQDTGPRSSLGSCERPSVWDSGLLSQQTAQTSVPSAPQLPAPGVDVSVAASSFASSMYSDSKNAQLVQMPTRGSDGRIKCEICQQSLVIANDWSWK